MVHINSSSDVPILFILPAVGVWETYIYFSLKLIHIYHCTWDKMVVIEGFLCSVMVLNVQ